MQERGDSSQSNSTPEVPEPRASTMPRCVDRHDHHAEFAPSNPSNSQATGRISVVGPTETTVIGTSGQRCMTRRKIIERYLRVGVQFLFDRQVFVAISPVEARDISRPIGRSLPQHRPGKNFVLSLF